MNRLLLALVTCGLIVGCSKREPVPPPEPVAPKAPVNIAEAAPETAPPPPQSDSAPAATTAKPTEEPEGPITPLTEREVAMLNYAVYKFREENGRLPKSIQEMIGKNLPRMPKTHPSERLVYDPSNGLIKVEKVK